MIIYTRRSEKEREREREGGRTEEKESERFYAYICGGG
jgi:hypothetical protein